MEEILKEAERFLDQEKKDVAYLEQVLEKLIRNIKGKSRPDKSGDQNAF